MLVVDARRRRRDPKAWGERRRGWNWRWGQTHQGEGWRRAIEVGQHTGGLIHTGRWGYKVLRGCGPSISRITRIPGMGPWRYSYEAKQNYHYCPRLYTYPWDQIIVQQESPLTPYWRRRQAAEKEGKIIYSLFFGLRKKGQRQVS